MMNKKQTIRYFLDNFPPFSDFWSMQFQWTVVVDDLIKDKEVNPNRAKNWGNPCIPETFKKFNQRFKGN